MVSVRLVRIMFIIYVSFGLVGSQFFGFLVFLGKNLISIVYSSYDERIIIMMMLIIISDIEMMMWWLSLEWCSWVISGQLLIGS